jgi:geranylgeranyl pyrophosphate synthase
VKSNQEGLPSPVTSHVQIFAASIEDELGLVETALHDALTTIEPIISTVASHILDAGGKRLRPTLVMLSAYASQGTVEPARLQRIAAIAELIHMASLMHDDVVDDAAIRRGRPSANYLWGSHLAVLVGDYVWAKASALLAEDGDVHIIRELSKITTAMTMGEISQLLAADALAKQASAHLVIVQYKTAEFISSCCRIGATLAGKMQTREETALAEFGLALGMAFQLTDDLLDLMADPAHTGKPLGSDIREGKATLPVIYALERTDPAERDHVTAIFTSTAVTASDITYIRDLCERTGALLRTQLLTAGYITQAIAHLHTLPPSPARDALEELAVSITSRQR